MKTFFVATLIAIAAAQPGPTLDAVAKITAPIYDTKEAHSGKGLKEDELSVKPNYIGKTTDLVTGQECETAIGHDGHYANGVWMLDQDYDAEPEWRCLLRPLLVTAEKKVVSAEQS